MGLPNTSRVYSLQQLSFSQFFIFPFHKFHKKGEICQQYDQALRALYYLNVIKYELHTVQGTINNLQKVLN